MNALVFTGLFPNNMLCQQGLFIKERVRACARLEGVKVRVVAPVPYYPPLGWGIRSKLRHVARHETIDGLEVTHPRYLMTPRVGMVSYGLLLAMSVFPHLKRIQRTFDFDLIDAHFVYPDGFAAVLLGKFLNKPVTISVRGSDVNRYKNLPFIPPLLRFALKRAGHVVTVSQALADVVQSLGVPKEGVTTIPNGVDSSQFFLESRQSARNRLGLGNDRIVISVGHLTWNKGFDVLIHAMKVLLARQARETIRLIVIGEGAIRSKLEAMRDALGLQDRVQFVGAVPHQQLRHWYNAADLVCLASKEEGCPNVLMEALACGTPVVATSVGGIPEIVQSSQLGYLGERNPQPMADMIQTALNRQWDRAAIAARMERHSWDRVAQEVLKVFRTVVEHRDSMYSSRCVRQLGTGQPGGHA